MDDMSFFAVVRYSSCNLLTITSLTFGNGEIERGTSTIPQLRLRQTGLIEMVGDHWSPLQCLAYLSKFYRMQPAHITVGPTPSCSWLTRLLAYAEFSYWPISLICQSTIFKVTWLVQMSCSLLTEDI